MIFLPMMFIIALCQGLLLSWQGNTPRAPPLLATLFAMGSSSPGNVICLGLLLFWQCYLPRAPPLLVRQFAKASSSPGKAICQGLLLSW